jgi:hypothetical protein
MSLQQREQEQNKKPRAFVYETRKNLPMEAVFAI